MWHSLLPVLPVAVCACDAVGACASAAEGADAGERYGGGGGDAAGAEAGPEEGEGRWGVGRGTMSAGMRPSGLVAAGSPPVRVVCVRVCVCVMCTCVCVRVCA